MAGAGGPACDSKVAATVQMSRQSSASEFASAEIAAMSEHADAHSRHAAATASAAVDRCSLPDAAGSAFWPDTGDVAAVRSGVVRRIEPPAAMMALRRFSMVSRSAERGTA